jgi:hypothetical protein
MDPVNRHKRQAIVVGVALIAVAVASLVYLGPQLFRHKPVASATPSPVVSPIPSPLACATTQLNVTGLFNECADVGTGLSCPGVLVSRLGSKAMYLAGATYGDLRVEVLFHGTTHDFILYIEVKGAYHGPDTYPLVRWPHDSLGVNDGIAKVALREGESGRFWESTAGSVTINDDEHSGWVYAGLGADPGSPAKVPVSIAGWWSCS